MDERLSNPDKEQIVMARRLGRCISKMVGLVGCSHYAVVRTYQKMSRERQLAAWQLGREHPRLTYACGEQRSAYLGLIIELP